VQNGQITPDGVAELRKRNASPTSPSSTRALDESAQSLLNVDTIVNYIQSKVNA